MKQPQFNSDWPKSWQESYRYDLDEVWGESNFPGYANSYTCRQEVALRLVSEAVSPPASILDIAAAQGNFTLKLAEKGYDVTWNDLRSELIDFVKLKYETGSVQYRSGNAFELEFKTPFDLAIALEIIEHVAHPDEFLTNLSSLVRTGGYLVLSTPNGAYFLNKLPRFSECPDPSVFESVQFKPNSDGHIFLLYQDELVSLAERAGLRVVELTFTTNFLTNGHIKTGYLLKLLPQKVVNMIEQMSRRLPLFLRRKLHTNICVLYEKI